VSFVTVFDCSSNIQNKKTCWGLIEADKPRILAATKKILRSKAADELKVIPLWNGTVQTQRRIAYMATGIKDLGDGRLDDRSVFSPLPGLAVYVLRSLLAWPKIKMLLFL